MNDFMMDYDRFKRTWTVKTELPVEFKLTYSADIFNPANHDLVSYKTNDRIMIVIDQNVHKFYAAQLMEYFNAHDVKYRMLVIDTDEENKTWKDADHILQFFEDEGVLRREPIIAIGGGVLLDIVGFACSIYRRGIPYIKIPTTLLAIVDASVGSKVAVNHFGRRNRLGAYYPPIATLIDKKFIKTQSEREIINGIAEIFKLAVIKSPELFALLEENAELLIEEKFQHGAVPVRVINLAITDMIAELGPNLWERKLDRCVDFGHTFSPVIEMENVKDSFEPDNPPYFTKDNMLLHGEAVALDCLYSSCISSLRGHISAYTLNRIFDLAKRLKLKTYHEDFTKMELLQKSLADATKHRNGNQFAPLPISIGNYTIVNDITEKEMKYAIDLFRTYHD
jgi:2-epi-5-epi-valiolone synthase